jgi:L-alanine-DL-glutamate epimerase-like enolase superfamily enzyme
MKISGLDIRLLEIDARPRFGAEGVPPGRPATWHYPLVLVLTDEGVAGRTMGYGNQGDGRALACLLRDVFWAEIRGEDPRETERLWLKLRARNRHLYALSDALSGLLDVACWDILGQVHGRPICDLLGRARDAVAAYATGNGLYPTPEQVAAEAAGARAAGYHGYKLKFWRNPELDVAGMHAARAAVGPEFPLMQDLSGAYEFDEALRLGRVLDELGFHWFEEPIPDRQSAALRRLSDALRTPVLAGETVRLDELIEQVDGRCYDVARGDVYLKNGITGLMRALRHCERRGVRLEIHTMATPLLDVANLHCNCAAPNAGMAEIIHPIYRFGLRGAPLDIDAHGCLRAPHGPGLGVELDWDWIDRHTVERHEVR